MSTKDTLTAGLNEAVAKKNALKLDDYVAAAQKSVAANRDAETGYINSTYDIADANTQAQYDKAITDAKASYDNEYQKNSVQKIINEMKIEQNMANLGLTDSGLNRTQQTAVQLSYANQKGNIDLARQSAIEDLTLNLNAALAESEAGRSGALLTANEKWDNQAYSLGQTNYNNDLTAYNSQISSYAEQLSDIEQAEIDAAAEVQKAQISASAKTPTVSYGAGGTSTGGYIVSSKTGTLSRDYMGSLKDNGVSTVYNYNDDGSIKSVTYTDSNSGISATFDAGVNPYTGRMNKDVRDEDGYYDPSKAFDNGYQPNNIKGVKLKLEENNAINVNGQLQKVFKCGNRYYTWDGKYNEYFEVVKVDLGNGKHRWDEK